MIYVCSYSDRSYIVIDPSTCGACPPSLLAKNFAPSRDTTCASKTLKPKSYFQESTIPTYMRYFRAVLRKFVCAISNFQK